jgi:hypothetical protein
MHLLLLPAHAAGVLLGFFDPEDGGDMFRRNVGWLKPTTEHYIPEVRILHNRTSEILRPCSKFCGFASKYLKVFSLFHALELLL